MAGNIGLSAGAGKHYGGTMVQKTFGNGLSFAGAGNTATSASRGAGPLVSRWRGGTLEIIKPAADIVGFILAGAEH
ncbi:hypothetical protein J4732_08970 [Serratia marcescens]|uniref:Uncharacterized protein n=1 Tax=Serratia marcescens TaxID=615 RepID=A0A939NPS8_SERMA|nr:hypothetical protein [Serratia marcescens]